MEKNINVNCLFDEISSCEQVEAIALGGSRATGKNDAKSDYDVYVYVTDSVSEEIRRGIFSKYCSVMEIGNHYWELEDNCTLIDGVDIDIIYRDIDGFSADISRVVDECSPSNGYTTCMWHNLVTCSIIYDGSGRLGELQKQYSVPYPQALKRNIIDRNMKLLRGVLPSYDLQIKKAVGRGDLVSVNHRTAEFLASYFDVIFALNERTHPGEKRLMSLCLQQCGILPENFESNLNALFTAMFREDICPIIDRIIDELDKVVKNNI